MNENNTDTLMLEVLNAALKYISQIELEDLERELELSKSVVKGGGGEIKLLSPLSFKTNDGRLVSN